MNKKKSLYNMLVGFFSQIIILALGFVVPRIILTHYGSDTNGLTSTITQIFSYMALLEAGIGQATTNELYPYINGEHKDKDKISEVMSISRRYYRKVTILYGVVVILLSIILPLVLKTNIPYWTVFFIVLFEGMTGVVSFWFIQNWTTLLCTDGKNYIKSNIELVNKMLCYGIKIILAIKGVNIAFIQVGYFAVSLLKLILYKTYMDNHYGWVNYKCHNKERKLKDRNSYIITEIAWTIFSSTDMIVLSMFCSTELASVYAVYSMVFTALTNLLDAVYNGVRFNLGQSYHDSLDKYRKMHDLFNSFFMGTMTSMVCVAYLMIIPFVKLYTKGVTDVNYVNSYLPLMFCLVQLLSWSRYIAGNLTGLAGYAKKVSYISLIEAFTNLCCSLILVGFFGIVGVLLATVIALPLKSLYCNWISDTQIMKRKPYKTLLILGCNFLCFLIIVALSNCFTFEVENYMEFILLGIINSLICFCIVMTVNAIVNRNLLAAGIKMMNIVEGKFKRKA